MRIRQVKPQFFMDKDMAALSWRQRVTYIGLWCVADDAGWFDADYEEIARELFGFDRWQTRETWVLDAFYVLMAKGHIEVEPCGHAVIPKFIDHQRFSGLTKRVYTTKKLHDVCLSDPPADTRGDPRTPARIGNRDGTEQGTERDGTVFGTGSAPANTPDGAGATTNEENLPPHLRIVNVS